MIKACIKILVLKRKWFFYCSLLVIFFLGFVSSIPTFDGNLAGFDIKGNTYYTTSLRINKLFGGQNKVYLKISPSQDTLKNVFIGVQKLEKNLREKFPDAKLISLRQFYYGMFYKSSNNKTSLSDFLTNASSYPVLNDLISDDKKSFLLVMSLDSFKKFDLVQFNSIIHRPYYGITTIKALSFYHIKETIEKYIRRDLFVLSLTIIGFFVVFFLFIFRKLRAVFFTFFMVSISIFSSLFFFWIFGFHLNLVTILVIPVVLVLSLSDSVHLLNGYISFSDIEDKTERIKKVVSHYIVPSFYSSATTSAAFLTFYFFNDSEFIREFGLITGLCLMVEFLLTFLMAPYLLQFINVEKIRTGRISGFSNYLQKNQKAFSFIFIFLFISSFFFIHNLKFKSSGEMFFPKDSELYKSHNEFKNDFYSQLKLDILVENKSNTSDSVQKNNLTNNVIAITKIFRNTRNVVRVNSATDNIYIQSAFGISLNFYEKLGDKNPYYNEPGNIYRIEVKVKDPNIIKEYVKTILPAIEKQFPDCKISYSSPVLIMDYVNKKVSGSLVNSLLTSCFSILLMIFLLTRSISLTLASLLPNLVPLSIIVILYTLLGFEINILTAITAVVCLGLLDDDTIHILYRRLWLKEPLAELSFSILSTAILLSAGFGMFYFSSFKPTQVFGLVSALIFLLGVICELTLMHWIIDFWFKKNSTKK